MIDSGHSFDAWTISLAARLRLHRDDYHTIRHVALPGGDDPCIEHVIVSPYGIFVIETMDMKGRISGGADRDTWVLRARKGEHAFANPLPRHCRRARLLAALLGIDAHKVLPLLVFVGGCSFATPMPANVTKAGGCIRYIKSKAVPVLTRADVARIVESIEAGLSAPEPANPVRLVTAAKPAAKTCPHCGEDMDLRIAKKGELAGRQFWVCSAFPKCWGTIAAKAA